MGRRFWAPFVVAGTLVLLLGAFSAMALIPSRPAGLFATDQQAQNVRLVGQLGGPLSTLAVRGDYAYVGIGPRLAVVDVTNPYSPTLAGRSRVLPGPAEDVALAGDHAYVTLREAGFSVVDVSEDTAPSQRGFCATPGTAYGVAVSGTLARVADGDRGLRVIDASDPATQPKSIPTRPVMPLA